MHVKRYIRWFLLCATLWVCGALHAQNMGFEQDDWSSESSDNRFSGLSRKSGTFFRRAREDTPEAQLAHARALREQGRLRAAARQFNALVHQWPDAEEAAAAQLAFARGMQARGRYERAFREYQYLIEHYAGQFPYREILSEQLQAARSVKGQRRGAILFLSGFESPERAIPLFRIVIANGPNWEEIPDIRLLIGQVLEENRDYADAVAAYEEVIIYHGRHAVAREAIFRKAICLKKIADRNPRDERRTQVAMQALFAALREDLGAEQIAEAEALVRDLRQRLEVHHFEQAEFYDYKVRNPEAALLSYQAFLGRFPDSGKTRLVKQRIAELEATMTGKE